ncbi:MAG: TIGR04283 family arsenosugar biosynthesis glycosyltransferase [Chitinophagaceae bacterium]
MTISIIIPAYNEEEFIGPLVSFLKKNSSRAVSEIIVADGGSIDNTVSAATAAGATAVVSPLKSRSCQMNYGASMARGTILYFVHADTFPPASYVADILDARQRGKSLGRYHTKFLSRKKILWLNEWFTRFDFFICMGGDQTLFITKALFDSLGGFNSSMMLMEEYEFCARARQGGSYTIMNGAALVSARKYEKNSWLRVQRANFKVMQLYKKGESQLTLAATYKRMLNW